MFRAYLYVVLVPVNWLFCCWMEPAKNIDTSRVCPVTACDRLAVLAVCSNCRHFQARGRLVRQGTSPKAEHSPADHSYWYLRADWHPLAISVPLLMALWAASCLFIYLCQVFIKRQHAASTRAVEAKDKTERNETFQTAAKPKGACPHAGADYFVKNLVLCF
ncbi:hypothetical protein NDU88_002697 [Pleurodeles waltl]|uniref:Uncharacterized protein n=1 Tax=Pleurodeles waltl TaxID=8319 RepID=A0AAV7WQZ8_PLEWA|nr:hypothetical protein NDU88_002697 [Pleurodeles waltl]